VKPGDVVLVDTNVIIESHFRSCWAALVGAYRVQTAEQCIVESLTGRHDWNGKRPTEPRLRQSFDAIHPVSAVELAEVAIRGGSALDPGEQALWAHALARKDAWILCGPDRASMRFGYEQDQRERLVSLGGLLRQIRFTPGAPLRAHFEQAWLDDVINKLILGLV
jgi:hypothetical protein